MGKIAREGGRRKEAKKGKECTFSESFLQIPTCAIIKMVFYNYNMKTKQIPCLKSL